MIETRTDRILISQVGKQLATLLTTIIPIPNRHPVETILLRPTVSNTPAPKLPSVCIPHGGPHSCYVTSFSPAFAALALEGCTWYLTFLFWVMGLFSGRQYFISQLYWFHWVWGDIRSEIVGAMRNARRSRLHRIC